MSNASIVDQNQRFIQRLNGIPRLEISNPILRCNLPIGTARENRSLEFAFEAPTEYGNHAALALRRTAEYLGRRDLRGCSAKTSQGRNGRLNLHSADCTQQSARSG